MSRRVPLVAAIVCAAVVIAAAPTGARQTKPAGAAAPVMVLDTAKGTIEITLFPGDAPKSIDHIVALVRQGFYRGQRFHRVTASLAQFGDKKSRDMTLKDFWGTGGSGVPINAFEVSKTRKHVRGTVGLGHTGNPMAADSQLYIMKSASPSLDGKYAIVGQVTAGLAIVDKIAVEDSLKNVYMKGEGGK